MSAIATPAQQAMTLPEKVVEHIAVTSATLEKAAAFQQQVNRKQAQVQQLIPNVVDVMVEHERIEPTQREKLAEALKDHARCLELLIKVAGHRNAEELSRLGQGVDGQGNVVKTASHNGQRSPNHSLTSPHVGARTTMVKQSDVSLFSGLGLPSPTGE